MAKEKKKKKKNGKEQRNEKSVNVRGSGVSFMENRPKAESYSRRTLRWFVRQLETKVRNETKIRNEKATTTHRVKEGR